MNFWTHRCLVSVQKMTRKLPAKQMDPASLQLVILHKVPASAEAGIADAESPN